MAGQVFIHIGPPKTGTTSLQMAFETLSHPSYAYEGTLQPRERNLGSASQRLHDELCGEIEPEERDALQSDLNRISEFVDGGGVVVVSEEILSLNSPERPFQMKIDLLAELLNGIPTTILLTLRDPVVAIPSFYQEIFQSLPTELKMNFPQFCSDSRALCFDYLEMQDMIVKSGLPAVRWLDFAKIERNEMTTRDVFGEHDLWNTLPIKIGAANRGAKSPDGKARIIPSLTLGDVADLVGLKQIAPLVGLSNSRFSRWVVTWLKRGRLSRAKSRRLIVPLEREMVLRGGYNTILKDIANRQIDGRWP